MRKTLFIICSLVFLNISAQELTIIEQNYDKALVKAKKENKLLLIDFYTTWCLPCKKLEKAIFRNKTYNKYLADNFILLHYNAEDDKTYNLSKKYHINSYPTNVVLTNDGYLLNRKQGYSGKTAKELFTAVSKFTNESLKLFKKNKIIKGYSNQIKIEDYPQFYIDYVNRDDKKVQLRKDFKDYWRSNKIRLDEAYFSTLVYFASKVPTQLGDNFLAKRKILVNLYGQDDVDIALFLFSVGKFKEAIKTKSHTKFKESKLFCKEAMNKDAEGLIKVFQKQFDEQIK